MAEATSPASGHRYGIARVCRVWQVPRSSFYAARQSMPDSAGPPAPARRGPKPTIPDEALLAAIREDLDLSPWTGEGHRKVWARLRGRHAISGVAQARPAPDARERPAVAAPCPAAPRGGA